MTFSLVFSTTINIQTPATYTSFYSPKKSTSFILVLSSYAINMSNSSQILSFDMNLPSSPLHSITSIFFYSYHFSTFSYTSYSFWFFRTNFLFLIPQVFIYLLICLHFLLTLVYIIHLLLLILILCSLKLRNECLKLRH